MKSKFKIFIIILDILFLPLIILSGVFFRTIRKIGLSKFTLSKRSLFKIGVFPITKHYYEPNFDYRGKAHLLTKKRELKGINFDEKKQFAFLKNLNFKSEIISIPYSKTSKREFFINNGAFCEGDAEYWYQIIRYLKPKNIIEIGSGFSTLMAIKAINKNKSEGFNCELTCIEPFEMPWLKNMNVNLIRKKVENIELSFFEKLNENDILFIDSSHMINPTGDVLYEYLHILPSLNKGVYVHLHDICTPYHYPIKWYTESFRFWNEQYLLEAFLTNNSNWEIIGSLCYLQKDYHEILKKVSPFLNKEDEVGSFYIKKIK